jgi:hypothetical protein
MEREAIVKKKQEDIADNNEQSWLKVQRTFLTKWIDTSLKIELKEERAKSVQKQNEMLTVTNREEMEKRRLINEDKQYITKRLRRIRMFRRENQREKTLQRNKMIERRLKARRRIIERKRFAAEQSKLIRKKIDEEIRIANIKNDWTQLEQLYTSLGIPPPPKGTIVAQDYAKEYQAKEKEKRNSILDNSNKNKETYGKIKEKKRVRFHCPVPNTEIHASDLHFVLSKKNVFDKLKKITPKGDFQNVLDSPKLLRESLIELGFEDGVGNKEYEDLKERKKRFKKKEVVQRVVVSTPKRPEQRDGVIGNSRTKSRNQTRPLSSGSYIINNEKYDNEEENRRRRPRTAGDVNNNNTTMERRNVVRTPINRRIKRPRRNNRRRPATAASSGPALARKRIQERYRKFLMKSMSR